MLKTAIKILRILLVLVQKWQSRRELNEKQREADNLANSPTDWYNDHFDGVRDDKTDNADKANADSNTKR